MQAIMVIIKKQLKDTLKNKTILIQFLLFPVMTLIMEQAITLEGMPELYFTKLFSIMYIGMAPITSISAIISEEKEKNTLRVLMMANVKHCLQLHIREKGWNKCELKLTFRIRIQTQRC